MQIIELTAFLIMTAAILTFLKQSPFELAKEIASLIKLRKPTLQQQILTVQKPKKLRGIRRILQESKQILKATNQTDKYFSLSVMSLALFVLGLFIAISLNNIYLVPVLAIGFALLPNIYVLYSSSKYKKQLNSELESALSTITTSYLRTENFIAAVRENLEYLNPPVYDVFKRFLYRVENVDPDVIAALEDMKTEIDHSVYQEWIDQIILCQDDRNLKSTLSTIVNKFSKIRTVTGEVEVQLYKPKRTYLMMLGLLYGIILVICVGNADWAHYLLDLAAGKLIIALVVLATLVTLVRVIQITKPIEYKR